nr:pitrilysin family protein [uncultured Holophaga sp.]
MAESLFCSTTPGGTQILIETLPQVKSCALGFWVKRGSCHEGPAQEGLAHFIEHTVFKGTERYPDPEALAEATDRLGGNVDAFTGKETACFYGKVLRDQLPELVAMLGDLVTTPCFDETELTRERGVILEEIAQSEDQPDDWVSELFYMNFWKGGALAHPILGTRESVASFGAAEARAFFGETYRAPNLLVSAAGDIDPGELTDLLAPILDRMPGGAPSPQVEPHVPKPFLLNVPRRELQQASLVLALPVCGHQGEDRMAVNLLSHVLGGGMSSRLFLELREKHALCYQVGSYLSHYRDSGALQVMASCAPGKARELVQRASAEMVRLARHGASADELERAKLQARTSLVFSQESSSARMFSLAHQTIHMDRLRSLDELLAEISAVTLEELNDAATRLLAPGTLAVTALGVRKGDEIRKADLG